MILNMDLGSHAQWNMTPSRDGLTRVPRSNILGMLLDLADPERQFRFQSFRLACNI